MKNNHFLSIFFLFLIFSIKSSFAGGLIDAARDITAGALNFAGDVVEKTGDVVHDVVDRTAEVIRPDRYEVVEEPAYVEKELFIEPMQPAQEKALEPEVAKPPVLNPEPEIAASSLTATNK